jgi:hypothetical protein
LSPFPHMKSLCLYMNMTHARTYRESERERERERRERDRERERSRRERERERENAVKPQSRGAAHACVLMMTRTLSTHSACRIPQHHDEQVMNR